MRQVTENAVDAFLSKGKFKSKNTRVETVNNQSFMYLHDNLIARIDYNDDLYITDAGWATNTTKERLNALPGVSICQKNFDWYLNGQKWTGEETRIGNLSYL